ncbi:hypothetical protein EON67_04675 [archaeon]|nr:MAG: hypothetical protein EON67_04675 [archaeon]
MLRLCCGLVCVLLMQDLYHITRGMDVDAPSQRAAVARFVGFEMPQGAIPLDSKAPAKYASSLSRVTSPDQFKGVDNMKAQYYGVSAVVDEKLATASVGKKPQPSASAAAVAAAAAATTPKPAARTGEDSE